MLEIIGIELPTLAGPAMGDLLPLLSLERQAKIKGLGNDLKALQSIWGELLMRSLARSMFEIDNCRPVLATGEYGKPFLPTHPDFHFSVSHSALRVICAADSQPIGVDIELTRPMDIAAARIWFSPDEHALVEETCAEEQIDLFYAIWTLKESYAKAAGLGFHLDPKSFTVLPEGKNRARIAAEEHRPARFFRRYRLEGGYCAAVCSCGESFPEEIRQVDSDTILRSLGID